MAQAALKCQPTCKEAQLIMIQVFIELKKLDEAMKLYGDAGWSRWL